MRSITAVKQHDSAAQMNRASTQRRLGPWGLGSLLISYYPAASCRGRGEPVPAFGPAAAVLRSSGFDFEQPAIPAISVGLIPVNPLLQEAEEAIVAEQSASEAIAEESQSEPEAEDVQLAAEPPEQTLDDQAVADTPDTAEPSEPEYLEAAPIAMPSLLTIQNSVRREREQQAIGVRDWANSCSELQQVAGTLGCQQSSEPDYQAATVSPERQSVYEFHNPVVERSRSVETSPVIAAQARELAASLALNNIPAELADYLMEEVEAGISLYSGQGNLALQNMDIMVNTNESAQFFRDINSPWVQLATRQQQERRYLNRQDQERFEKCSSGVLLIFAPAEIAECVNAGNFGFLLSPLNFEFPIDY